MPDRYSNLESKRSQQSRFSGASLMSVFSFSGRINRRTWWLTQLTLSAIGLLLTWAVLVLDRYFSGGFQENSDQSGEVSGVAFAALFVLFIGYIVASTATNVRRLHDRGRSGFYLVAGYIPIIGWLWLYIEMGLLSGDHQGNSFGQVPGTILIDMQPSVESHTQPSTSAR